MGKIIKPFVLFFLSSLLLVSAAIAYETNEQEKKDPQVELCKQQCKQQAGLDKWQKKACQEKCQQKRSGGSSIMEEWNPDQSPRERLQECQQQCESREQQHRPECREQCEDRYKQEQQQQGQDPQKQYQECKKQCQRESEPGRRQKQEREKCDQKCEQQLEERQREGDSPRNPTYEGEEESQHHQQQGEEDENPYVFDKQHFSTPVKTQQYGSVRVLQKFHRHSKLLRGLKNYRLVILEANPQTFVLPHHCDAETIIFVAEGRGTISLVHSERRESLNLRRGDILRIPAGTTVYLINRDNNEKLVIAKLVQPVSTPGSFEEFFGAGGENPESYFRAFSTELLEAAFNTKRDRLQKFGQQREGIIVKASEEQIRAMSQHQEGGVWPFGESRGTTNLFQKRPEHSNQYGEVREVTANDYTQLEDLGVAVSFVNITKGAMQTPMYNSKSTKISIVLNGEGYFEMACPHLGSSSESEEERQQGESSNPTHYQKVNGPLRQGKVLVVPAGHPIIMVASNNRNLEVLCFEINAKDNERVPLAGKKNIWNQVEKEAKELAFGIPSREVESILENQKQDWFFKGPRQQPQQHQGRAYE